MSQADELDLSHLPPVEISSKAPLWWGQAVLCAIEASMFFVLIAIYLYLRLRVDVWPSLPSYLPAVTLPTVALLPLIVSTAGSYWASAAAQENDRMGMISGMGINVFFTTIFLAMRFVEWKSFNFTWITDAHGSVIWTILFLHTLDAVADTLFTIVLIACVASGKYGHRQRLGVHVDSVVWYFIVGIWLPLYGLIYWVPRFLKGVR